MLELGKFVSTLHGKIIAGAVAATLAGGAGVVTARTAGNFYESDQGSSGRTAESSTSANARAEDDIAGNTSNRVSASGSAQSGSGGTGTSAGYNASAPGTSGSAGVNLNSGIAVLSPAIPGMKPIGSGGGIPTNPGGIGPSGPGSGQIPSVSTPGVSSTPSIQPAVPSTPSVEPVVPGLGIPVPAPPSATTPSGLAVYEKGTYSVVVPGTAGDSQQLCLSGTLANKCRTVKVPPTKSVTLTISYSGNASVSAPAFTVNRCDRGLQIGVNGLTPGSGVEANAEGVSVSTNLGSNEVGQTASFCKG